MILNSYICKYFRNNKIFNIWQSKVFLSSYSQNVPHRIFNHGLKNPKSKALCDEYGNVSYGDLLKMTISLKKVFLQNFGLEKQDFSKKSIAFLAPNDRSYVISKLCIWMLNSVSVPLSPKHRLHELCHIVKNSSASVIISHSRYKNEAENVASKTGAKVMVLPDIFKAVYNEDLNEKIEQESQLNDPAMILYTSGTTGQPKGVLLNHLNLAAQVDKMLTSWQWTKQDNILHVLPLHHTHGVVNALLCPLVVGAQVTMEPSFNVENVWKHFLNNQTYLSPLTVFMAVPTIYFKLIQYYDDNKLDEKKPSFSLFRLMVSGSAALPVSVLQKWEIISNHTLLERYGMTEFGMGLTNSYKAQRFPGCVGLPFTDTQVKIVGTDSCGSTNYDKTLVYANGKQVDVRSDVVVGELLVMSPSVFQEYVDNPSATANSFHKGWFKTGDTCAYENGVFRIVGRTSVDIIKSGGYKIGALEIEACLLEHPLVEEVAVLGVPDTTWGERVSAVIKLSKTNESNEQNQKVLTKWCREKMADYRIPRSYCFVNEIPRNAMGKVNKKELLNNLFL